MKKIHQLKVSFERWEKYLRPESWSIRDTSDRQFRVGDFCLFQCTTNENNSVGNPQRTIIIKEIIEVMDHIDFRNGLKEGYCILTLALHQLIEYQERF